jgi:hypothetical protein
MTIRRELQVMSMSRAQFTLLILTVASIPGSGTLQAAAVAETHRLEEAPYYIDVQRKLPRVQACGGVLHATADPGLADTFVYEGRERELAPLLDAVNARIDSMHGCVRALPDPPASAGSPRIYVGSAESDYAPIDVGNQRVPGDRFAPMVLHLAYPGSGWRDELAAIAARTGVDRVVVVQLGVSQYMKGYSSVLKKQVALGTGYNLPIRFLTAEDKPVEVLHLTGALLDANGKVLRAGAEGIVLRDTPFVAQAFDVSRSFDHQELQRVLTDARRHDLPGAPLAIDVALHNLLAQLTRGEIRVPAH